MAEKIETIQIPNEKLEQIILKKFFNDYEYTALISEAFDKRLFSNNSISLLMSILIAYQKKYNKIPSENILEMLIKKIAEKDEKLSVKKIMADFNISKEMDISKDESFIKDNVLSFLKSKSLYFTIMDNFSDIEKHQDVSKCIDKFQKISALGFDLNLGFDYFQQLDKHFEDIANPEAKISTGFKQLDAIMAGGLPRFGKCLAVFMSQPFMGKSLMLSNLSVNFMQQGLFPLIISLEMCETVYGARIDAHISGENINALQFNIDKTKNKIRDFEKLYKDAKLLIKEYSPSSVSCNNLASYIEKIIRLGRKPDVILIDYINLLRPNSNGKDNGMYERIGEVTVEMRGLSYKFERPVVSCTQTNREGSNNTNIGFEHTSQSYLIPATVDFLATLWQNEGDREANKLNSTPIKNRIGGIVGKNMEFFINYNNLRLTDFNRENVASEEEDVTQDVIHSLERL